MEPAAYSTVLGHAHAVRLVARQLDVGELDEAIAAIDTADAAGSVLSPTLYRERADAMREDRQTLVAVRELGLLGEEST